jgi:hypothetical protein
MTGAAAATHVKFCKQVRLIMLNIVHYNWISANFNQFG